MAIKTALFLKQFVGLVLQAKKTNNIKSQDICVRIFLQ